MIAVRFTTAQTSSFLLVAVNFSAHTLAQCDKWRTAAGYITVVVDHSLLIESISILLLLLGRFRCRHWVFDDNSVALRYDCGRTRI